MEIGAWLGIIIGVIFSGAIFVLSLWEAPTRNDQTFEKQMKALGRVVHKARKMDM